MKYISGLLIIVFFAFSAKAQVEEFYGPFPSWTNLKQAYHAVGDGKADDTRALQAALDDLGKLNHSPVLFIPNGTYRITATLTMQSRTGVAVIGENPLQTIIKWEGDKNKKMFSLNGVSYSEFGRITWDGNNIAAVAVAHEWDGHVQYANSGTQHSDEIFMNVGTGLKSGANMDAEFTIRRCRFYHCTSTGISLQGWNALDWWVWDCYFENCNAGIANNLPGNGAGNFHVYRSIFKKSSYADISLGNSLFYSFRDNISYNSAHFIVASQFSNTSPITIQHNIIYSDSDHLVADLFTKGNVLFLDNTFVTQDSNKNYVIHYEDDFKNSHADLSMIGNSFTAKKKTLSRGLGRFIDIDNKYGVPKPAMPSITPKPFAPLVKYPIYEINNKMTTDDILSIIKKAASSKKKSILHFSYGDYKIARTLIVPGNSPLIFLGDGLQSFLTWKGDTATAVIQVNAPSACVFRSLRINGGKKADGILLLDNDKPGNTIYSNELLAYSGIKTNVFIDGFKNTSLRFENFQHNYCSKGISVLVKGTGNASSQLKIFGCASVSNKRCYDVDDNGRILVYDNWYENANDSNFITMNKSGEFILNGAMIANTNNVKASFVEVNNFKGNVSIVQAIYNAHVKKVDFSNNSADAHLLIMGILNWADSTMSCYDFQSAAGKYAFIHNRYNIGKGSYELPDEGNTSNEFISQMLAGIRNTLVSAKPAAIKNAAHFTLDRVMIENSINNFHVEKSN